MITKEEREKIQARREIAKGVIDDNKSIMRLWKYLVLKESNEDILVLLNSLDEAETSISLLKELLDDIHKRLHGRGMEAIVAEADRDNWKRRAEADRACDHAGKCEGCHIKQTECFSYSQYLAKKYEALALKNAVVGDKYKARADAFEQAMRKSRVQCFVCINHYGSDECKKYECCDGDCPGWQFDEAKFSTGGDGE